MRKITSDSSNDAKKRYTAMPASFFKYFFLCDSSQPIIQLYFHKRESSASRFSLMPLLLNTCVEINLLVFEICYSVIYLRVFGLYFEQGDLYLLVKEA